MGSPVHSDALRATDCVSRETLAATTAPEPDLPPVAPQPSAEGHTLSAPFAPGSTTSRRAADLILPRVGTLRRRVYDVIASTGRSGATRTEIAETASLSENTVRPRVLELIAAKLIAETSRQRAGRSVLVVIGYADDLFAGAA